VLGAGRGALTHREAVATLKTGERREWCASARRSAARMALVSRINRDGDIQFTGKGAPRDQPEVCRPPYRGLWSFYLCSWDLAVRGFQDIRLLRRCWYKIVGKAQGQVNVKGPRPGTSPVKLARYLSKYISKDIDSQPREFEEHRYFCSLGIAVPTERFQIVLKRHARDAQSKLFFLMFNDTLRRVGDYCTVRHWIGGAGTFGWISGFEDPTCHWSRNTSSSPHVPGWGTNS